MPVRRGLLERPARQLARPQHRWRRVRWAASIAAGWMGRRERSGLGDRGEGQRQSTCSLRRADRPPLGAESAQSSRGIKCTPQNARTHARTHARTPRTERRRKAAPTRRSVRTSATCALLLGTDVGRCSAGAGGGPPHVSCQRRRSVGRREGEGQDRPGCVRASEQARAAAHRDCRARAV